jgi:selenocysteine lyase/cysteine desulfurase
MFMLLQVVTELINGLQAIPGVAVYGIADLARFDRRTPAVAFTLKGYTPRQVAKRLGVEESGGMVRVGIAHYNTAAEVDRLLAVVNDLAQHP